MSSVKNAHGRTIRAGMFALLLLCLFGCGAESPQDAIMKSLGCDAYTVQPASWWECACGETPQFSFFCLRGPQQLKGAICSQQGVGGFAYVVRYHQ